MSRLSDRESDSFAHELDVAIGAARRAGSILIDCFAGNTETWEKSEGNPVTQADIDADASILGDLVRCFPDDGVLTEESRDDLSRLERERCWIVDPMDGTKEFTQNLPEFSVSIALALRAEPVVAVVFNPLKDVLYTARRGGGCFRNGVRVRVSGCARLCEAHVLASRSELKQARLEKVEDWFASLGPMGSIAWKLALVAGGEIDFNVSMRPKSEWDVCAGDLLVREAGGEYLDFAGERRVYNMRDPVSPAPMAAGSPALLAEFRQRYAGAET